MCENLRNSVKFIYGQSSVEKQVIQLSVDVFKGSDFGFFKLMNRSINVCI